ncbi:MAG TPA: sigma 54-interacting transcriptional regulator [Dongiaceae bacterium]|nr:sigma 54-interacting transcriptional regulator [Dongiaceae bacterium]
MSDTLNLVSTGAETKYRTLLDVSATVAAQPNLDAVVRSLRRMLAAVIPFDSITLFLFDEQAGIARLLANDYNPELTGLKVGTEACISGTSIGTCIAEQRPVSIPDIQAELAQVPEFSSQIPNPVPNCGYIFPLSTSRRKLGALAFTKSGEFSKDDVELMTSISLYVAAALESAVASDEAARYHRQVADDRDRFRLLLEINNHVVTKLDMDELFRSASASIRKYFRNDFIGFWLLDREAARLECAVLDFPGGQALPTVPIPDVPGDHFAKLRARRAELWSSDKIEKLPGALCTSLKRQNITSLAIVPLTTANGPLGVIAAGSQRTDAFGQEDLDLLSQVSSQIALAIDNALAYGRLAASKDRIEEERFYLESEIRSEFNFDDIVGNSPALRKVLDQIAIVAPTDSTVLLHGETGTGKELIARAIHSNSLRKGRTFVRLNCAAIPSGLLESELFGHERGAFTGALMQKKGRFELADHGSLFLDEIGDISLELQPKLLRALQEKEFERLGSTRTIQVDVRLIAATHRDLAAMIRNNQFREDLFYRLNVFPVEIPPLRDRREDIPLLVHYFVSRLSSRMQKGIKTVPKRALEAIANAPWPGNIRQLENFIERCVILSNGEQLNVPISEIKTVSNQAFSIRSTLLETERQAIITALKSTSGKVAGPAGAAERLGVKRTTLQNKIRRLKINKSEYQDPAPAEPN